MHPRKKQKRAVLSFDSSAKFISWSVVAVLGISENDSFTAECLAKLRVNDTSQFAKRLQEELVRIYQYSSGGTRTSQQPQQRSRSSFPSVLGPYCPLDESSGRSLNEELSENTFLEKTSQAENSQAAADASNEVVHETNSHDYSLGWNFSSESEYDRSGSPSLLSGEIYDGGSLELAKLESTSSSKRGTTSSEQILCSTNQHASFAHDTDTSRASTSSPSLLDFASASCSCHDADHNINTDVTTQSTDFGLTASPSFDLHNLPSDKYSLSSSSPMELGVIENLLRDDLGSESNDYDSSRSGVCPSPSLLDPNYLLYTGNPVQPESTVRDNSHFLEPDEAAAASVPIVEDLFFARKSNDSSSSIMCSEGSQWTTTQLPYSQVSTSWAYTDNANKCEPTSVTTLLFRQNHASLPEEIQCSSQNPINLEHEISLTRQEIRDFEDVGMEACSSSEEFGLDPEIFDTILKSI